jgi:C-terminal processing protease CtpA/Prc
MNKSIYLTYLTKINREVTKQFPFESPSQYAKYEDRYLRVVGKISDGTIDNLAKFYDFVKDLLLSLNNSHTKVGRYFKKGFKAERTKTPQIVSKVLDGNIGYVSIPNWSDNNLVGAVEKSFAAFFNKNIKGLILDVRDNRGGNSANADQVSGHFFEKEYSAGTVKTRVHGTFRYVKRKMIRKARKPYYNWPIVLLVGEKCFSSNEIFIATLKDNKRAYLVGSKTSGGSGNPHVISIKNSEGEFMAYITTWVYLRPNGSVVEGKGITPDIIVKGGVGYKKDGALVKARAYLGSL